MRPFRDIFTILFAAAMVFSATTAYATNGDNLISVGPISRAMGGVGIASPQDAVSAVFANPAAMCFAPYCPSTQADASVDFFIPSVKAEADNAFGNFSANSETKAYPLPALGASIPLSESWPNWRLGIAAYGVSGLGVDYRETDLDKSDAFGPFNIPRTAGWYTDLQTMKLAPSLAAQVTDWLSLGFAVHVTRSTLDLGNGKKGGWTAGFQPGFIIKPIPSVSIGGIWISPQSVDYSSVADFDGNGQEDDLTLESPQVFGLGVAWEPIPYKLLFEVDGKFINWSQAQGYDDFDWSDQWVLNLGVQYRPLDWLTLRAGYNWGSNPVKEHSDFNGDEIVDVQGYNMPRYYYESFRIIGFPAIAEHHITAGVGFTPIPDLDISLSYLHAFSNSIEEEGSYLGAPARFKSTLSEDSFGLGISYRF